MRPQHEPPARADLVVVGAGIVGAATAFEAARRGIDAVVLERRSAPATLTTAVAAGGLRLQLEHEQELGLVRATLELLERFSEATGQTAHDPRLRRAGYLWLTCDERRAAFQRELVERQRSWGLDGVELVDQAAIRQRFPWVSERVIQARYRRDDALLDPRSITFGLLEDVPVVLGATVTGFEIRHGRVTAVRSDRGRIACERAVIACGPLSGRVAELAAVELPVQPLRRQRVVIWGAPSIPAGAPMTIDEDTTTHFRPVGSGGAYLLHPDADEPPAEPLESVPADPAFAFRLLDPASPDAMARTVPLWKAVWERGAHWAVQAGQYTMTPDQRPLIGQTGVAGLWVNTGYSGHGVMAGPGGAAHLAGLLAGGEGADNPFRIDRPFVPSSQAF